MKAEKLEWTKYSSICIDGAPAMPGSRTGFTARVKEMNPNVIVTESQNCLVLSAPRKRASRPAPDFTVLFY